MLIDEFETEDERKKRKQYAKKYARVTIESAWIIALIWFVFFGLYYTKQPTILVPALIFGYVVAFAIEKIMK